MNKHYSEVFEDILPKKWRLGFAILGVLFSVVIFLIVQSFLKWMWIDYKPPNAVAPVQSLAEMESHRLGIPTAEVFRRELLKTNSDLGLLAGYTIMGFLSAFFICRVLINLTALEPKEKKCL